MKKQNSNASGSLDGWLIRSAVFAGLMILLAGIACTTGGAKASQPQGMPPMPVKVQVAQATAVSQTSDYVATLKSRDSAIIMPEVDGRVTQILVHSGEQVAAGKVMMEIDPRKQEATVSSQIHNRAAQEATVAYAQQQYDRTNGLYQAGVVSKQDLDQAKSALDNAKAQLSALDAQVSEQQVQLHYYSVVAPWNGIVGDIPVRVGDRVTVSTQLTTVDKPGSLEAYVYVPVERSPDLKLNMPVQIVDGQGKVIADSRISFVSPEVDNTTQSVLIKALISNHQDQLRQLQFIRARIVWGTQSRPTVPVLAVSRIGGQYFVFVAEDADGKTVAHQKPLRVGDMVGNSYEVLEGIKPGDKIIVSGTQFLIDGAPVAPQS